MVLLARLGFTTCLAFLACLVSRAGPASLVGHSGFDAWPSCEARPAWPASSGAVRPTQPQGLGNFFSTGILEVALRALPVRRKPVGEAQATSGDSLGLGRLPVSTCRLTVCIGLFRRGA